MIVTNNIESLYQHDNVISLHCVMELSMTDWKMMLPFSIYLGGYKIDKVN